MISRLQYISQAKTPQGHLDVIRQVCEAGGDWIQLRIKGESAEIIRPIAEEVKGMCQHYGATFVLNDYVEIAKEVGADGVHVGKTDMIPSTARAILGEGKIIGGTANTWEDVERLAREEVDYIGLGPFRFTSTKEKLSPVLGLEGYERIVKKCEKAGIHIPVVAIGGIQIEDVASLRKMGVYGVAVSGSITYSPDKTKMIMAFLAALG